MKTTRATVIHLAALVLTACTSPTGGGNFLAAIPEGRIHALRFGDWNFVDDPSRYPYPVVENPIVYYETDSDADLQRIVPLIRQLAERRDDEFILMCGFLTKIAILDENLHWIGEVAINADSQSVSLSDDPLHPTKRVSAYSSKLAWEVFQLMRNHVPDVIDKKLRDNPCIRDHYSRYITNGQDNAVDSHR